MSMPVEATTLTLGIFWQWVGAHYNCIVRAGSDTCVFFDQPFLHWHLIEDLDGQLVAQLIRGKDLVGELVIDPRMVLYVEVTAQDDEQVLFELVVDSDGEPIPQFHFLMAHGYDEDQDAARRGWTH